MSAAPLFRLFCHCTICQRYNRAALGDVALFHAADVTVIDESSVDFEAWKKPPLVQRGLCRGCASPAWERIALPGGLTLIGVPAGNITSTPPLPAPSAHIYYGTRLADAHDGLPTHGGALSSNIAWARLLVSGLLTRRRASRARP